MKSLCLWAARALLLAATAALALLATVTPAEAATQSAIGASKTMGIGLEAGHGAGLSLKYQPAPSYAFQFGLNAYDYGRYRTFHKGRYYYGYDYGYDAGAFLIHADYLMTQANLARSARGFRLPWYAGGGVDLGVGSGAAIGFHGDLGMAMQFTGPPIDLFIEWTPRLWLVDFFQLQPFEFNGGIRVWF